MSKKDYERLAYALQYAYLRAEGDPGRTDGVTMARDALANALSGDNGAFNAGRFRRACVPGANVRARTAGAYVPAGAAR